MLFHKENKLCMFLPPKTGTQTARVFLKGIGWHEIVPSHDYPESYLAKYPNLSMYTSHIFFRNPLDRFVSALLNLKREPLAQNKFQQVVAGAGLTETLESLSYEQAVDLMPQLSTAFPLLLGLQSRWATLPGTEILDFDNYEAEIRRISGDYTNPLVVQNKSTDFGKSVVTQKVIDFVRQHYAADYALAKDRLGKEY